MRYHTDASRHAHHDIRGNDPFPPIGEDGYTQYESEFVEATRPTYPECKAAATELIDDVMERAMIEAAKSYGAAQTARETFLLDRLRKELIDSECRALFYKSALREPAK